jgi:hypothetical protein
MYVRREWPNDGGDPVSVFTHLRTRGGGALDLEIVIVSHLPSAGEYECGEHLVDGADAA